jgi:hypothetical protein
MRETISLNLAHWKSDYLLQFTQSSGSGSTKIKMLLAAPASNLMFNIGGLSKMSHTVTVLYFSFYFYDKLTHKKSSEKFVLTLI